MRRNIIYRIAALVVTSLYLSSLAFGQFPGLMKGHVANTTYRLRQITLEYSLSKEDPVWQPVVGGIVPSEAEGIKFTFLFSDNAGPLPDQVRVKVDLRRVCKLHVNGNRSGSRRHEFFKANSETGEDRPIQNRVAFLEFWVHPCTNCPCPSCPFCTFAEPDDPDREHLGQGPYDVIITTGDAGVGLASAATDSTSPISFMTTFRTETMKNMLKILKRQRMLRRARQARLTRHAAASPKTH